MDQEEVQYRRERDRINKMATEIKAGTNQDVIKIKRDILQKERGEKIANLAI